MTSNAVLEPYLWLVPLPHDTALTNLPSVAVNVRLCENREWAVVAFQVPLSLLQRAQELIHIRDGVIRIQKRAIFE